MGADKEFNSIIALIHECESFAKQYNVPGATINPYTNLTGKDVQSKWNEVKTLVPQRDQTLQDELKKQENNEALRRQFAEKSNQVGPWIERQMDAVAAIGMGMQGSLEEQLGRLREYEEAVYQFKPHLEELERINQQIQESFVFENRYTQCGMGAARHLSQQDHQRGGEPDPHQGQQGNHSGTTERVPCLLQPLRQISLWSSESRGVQELLDISGLQCWSGQAGRDRLPAYPLHRGPQRQRLRPVRLLP